MAVTPCAHELDFENRLNIVLVEPEIPGNTGSIGRLCVGVEANLLLVEPLGYSLDDKQLKRAGLDYWPDLHWRLFPSFEAVQALSPDPDRFHYLTTKTDRPYTEAHFRLGDFLVFGRETKGLPLSLREANQKRTLTIPFSGPIRSFNLAMSVGIVTFEALRQIKGGLS